jgi:hypothetical protein
MCRFPNICANDKCVHWNQCGDEVCPSESRCIKGKCVPFTPVTKSDPKFVQTETRTDEEEDEPSDNSNEGAGNTSRAGIAAASNDPPQDNDTSEDDNNKPPTSFQNDVKPLDN